MRRKLLLKCPSDLLSAIPKRSTFESMEFILFTEFDKRCFEFVSSLSDRSSSSSFRWKPFNEINLPDLETRPKALAAFPPILRPAFTSPASHLEDYMMINLGVSSITYSKPLKL